MFFTKKVPKNCLNSLMLPVVEIKSGQWLLTCVKYENLIGINFLVWRS